LATQPEISHPDSTAVVAWIPMQTAF